MGFQYTPFVITPDELKTALAPFTLFIDNARVPVDYTFTPTEIFISNYSKIYDDLCSGAMPDPNGKYWDYFAVTTDISSLGRKYFEIGGEHYKMYETNSRGFAPYFMPFAFQAYADNGKVTVSTRGSWLVTYAGEIMGFQLVFPEFSKNEIEQFGVKSKKEYESYSDYKLLRDNIMKITSALRFSMNGIEKKTQIRVSEEAKEMLGGFYCIKSRNITVL